MFIRILTTWTIYILLSLILPTLSQGASVPNNVAIANETMFEALVKKCPNLESSELKDNEIFTKRCLNWAEINSTIVFNPSTNPNVQCLILYEAVLSFCTRMGGNLVKFQGLNPINDPSDNFDLNSVCLDQHKLYPVKTEHNISRLIPNFYDCMLLCIGYSDSHISDVCKLAYYFTTFDVEKFLKNFDKVLLQPTGHNVGAEGIAPKGSSNGEVIDTKQAPNKLVQKDPLNEVMPVPLTTSNGTVNEGVGEHKEVKVPVSPDVETNQKKPAVLTDKPVIEADTKSVNPPVVPSENIDASKNSNGQVPKLPAEKAGAVESPLGALPAPEKDQRPVVPVKPVQDTEDYIDDKAQVLDGPDQEPEEEQEDGDEKLEPAMPNESSDSKVPSRKVKPSTVEDEAVNTFNTPDDDMDGDSYFFSYFTVIMCLVIVGYVGYHNRQKVLALILEGKKGRKPGRGRRPNSANYHKLDTNLEEAISSSCTKSASNVIY